MRESTKIYQQGDKYKNSKRDYYIRNLRMKAEIAMKMCYDNNYVSEDLYYDTLATIKESIDTKLLNRIYKKCVESYDNGRDL